MQNSRHDSKIKKTKTEEDYNMFDWWKKANVGNYANFSGRSRRKEYWYSKLVEFILTFSFLIIMVILGVIFSSNDMTIGFLQIALIIMVIFYLYGIIPSLAAVARRLHDTGRSGTYYFLSFIPLVGPIILLIYLCEDSQPGTNKWGNNPKENRIDEINEIGKEHEI
jgi:uncharacterized membrane protein YhaH (DUF805 family)